MNPYPAVLHFDDYGWRNGRRRVILTHRFSAITSLGIIAVPRGFISDGASIPKAAWWIIGSPFDEYLEASIIHDFLYSAQNTSYSRDEADFIFKELMWNTGVSRPKLLAMHAAVRLFGKSSFKARISDFP